MVDVTILHPTTTVDDYGNDQPDWTDPDVQEVAGAQFEPTATSQSGDGGGSTRATGNLYVQGVDLVIDSDARVVIRGETWEVDGDPMIWASGAVVKAQVPVVKVQGVVEVGS